MKTLTALLTCALFLPGSQLRGQNTSMSTTPGPRLSACRQEGRRPITQSLLAGRDGMRDEQAPTTHRAAFTPEGDILIVDATAPAVGVYSRSLELLQTIGREGGGPGEYRRPMDAARGKDGRTYVLDLEPPALLVFEPDGSLLREVLLDFPAQSMAVRADGVFLSGILTFSGHPLPAGARVLPRPALQRYDVDRDVVETWLSYDPSWQGSTPVYNNMFVRTDTRVGEDGEVYIGFEESYVIWRVEGPGSATPVVEGCLPRAVRQLFAERTEDPERGRRSVVMFTDFGVTSDGEVVVRGGLLDEDGNRPWERFRSDGTLVGAWAIDGDTFLRATLDPSDLDVQVSWDIGTGQTRLIRLVPPARDGG